MTFQGFRCEELLTCLSKSQQSLYNSGHFIFVLDVSILCSVSVSKTVLEADLIAKNKAFRDTRYAFKDIYCVKSVESNSGDVSDSPHLLPQISQLFQYLIPPTHHPIQWDQAMHHGPVSTLAGVLIGIDVDYISPGSHPATPTQMCNLAACPHD